MATIISGEVVLKARKDSKHVFLTDVGTYDKGEAENEKKMEYSTHLDVEKEEK